MMYHMWEIPSGMGWWMGFGGLWMILFWVGVIALIVRVIKILPRKAILRRGIIRWTQPKSDTPGVK